jgi:hypothetical protein
VTVVRAELARQYCFRDDIDISTPAETLVLSRNEHV